MKNLENISNLDELLLASKNEATPLFVNLCGSDGVQDRLMDQVVSKVHKKHIGFIGYQKLCGSASSIIRDELMVTKRPVILLLQSGEIRAIFGGISSSYELEAALDHIDLSQSKISNH